MDDSPSPVADGWASKRADTKPAVKRERLPGGWLAFTRADLADFIAKHPGDAATHRTVVEIAY